MNETVSSASGFLKILEDAPHFRIVKSIPEGMAPEIEAAVLDFMKSSHMPHGIDLKGFYYATLQAIANSSVLGGAGDLWLGTMDGNLVTYILAHVNNDYDGRLNYMVTQAWVRKDQRGQSWVKQAWEKVRQRAKDCLCGHFSVISSRGHTKAYCRFLGKGFNEYAQILKSEL
jgi:predicted butyrate kinase (DUF1464 family)